MTDPIIATSADEAGNGVTVNFWTQERGAFSHLIPHAATVLLDGVPVTWSTEIVTWINRPIRSQIQCRLEFRKDGAIEAATFEGGREEMTEPITFDVYGEIDRTGRLIEGQVNTVELAPGFSYTYDPNAVNVWVTSEPVRFDGKIIQHVHMIKVIVPVSDGKTPYAGDVQAADVPIEVE